VFEVKNLSFSYQVGDRDVQVLRNLNFRVAPGDFACIQGPSGSGKSTLFYILGFLLKPTSGQILFDGTDITRLSEEDLTVIRNRKIGFVFQQFHLLSRTSTLENILLPTRYPSELAVPGPEHREKAIALAEQLGLGAHSGNFPNQLSGGQQQRVAIARALMNDIDLILADEPTGNLDSKNALQILELLNELNRQGKTIILITHDSEVARRCKRVYHLKDGAFTGMEENAGAEPVTIPGSRAPQGTVATERGLENEQSPPSSVVGLLPRSYSFAAYQRIARSVMPLVTENLLRNKAKSLLTMLGVVIGVAAVLAMVTLGQFTQKRILETYEALGVNKLLIRGYPNWNLKATDAVAVSFKAFDWEKDFLPLRRLFPEVRGMSPELNDSQDKATAGGITINEKVTSLGVGTDYLAITQRKLQAGRNLSPYHLASRSPVCVVGYEIAEKLFARTNPLGQIITVTDGRRLNYPCQVIGVLAPVTANKDWSPPNLHVMVPYTYYATVSDSWWGSQIHTAAIQLESGADVEAAGKQIKSYFEQKYGKSANFYVDSDSTLIAQMKKFLTLFTVLLTAIALLSLVVGGIGINNMMLVSVTERIKEFGIRKALGATNRSIRVQVILESVVLCVAAGLLGVLVGFSAYELLIFGATQFVPNLKFEWVFEPMAMILSVVSIVAVGVASGFIPALRAEKLQVIEALRSE
jgi:macrolide transport system ATP-binding/permease protein